MQNTSRTSGGPDGRPPPPHKGYYRRGDHHPPHIDVAGLAQHVIFRLEGSMPAARLAEIRRQFRDDALDDEQYLLMVDGELDIGRGPTWLGRSEIGAKIKESLEFFDNQRYVLHAWCVMPNHVHTLFTPQGIYPMESILHSWKSFTANQCNGLLKRRGAFWQEDYFDRYMRDADDLLATARYIANNPVKAGLAKSFREWPFTGGRLIV